MRHQGVDNLEVLRDTRDNQGRGRGENTNQGGTWL